MVLADATARGDRRREIRTILEFYLTIYLLRKRELPGLGWKDVCLTLENCHNYYDSLMVDDYYIGWMAKEFIRFFLFNTWGGVIKLRTVKSFVKHFERNHEEIIEEFCSRHRNMGRSHTEEL